MAELNIEKKKGMGMWVWLILLLIVIGLVWWLFGRDDDVPPVVGTDTVGVVSDMDTMSMAGDVDTAPITDVVVIVSAPDRRPLIGRRVQLTSVPVLAVSGDETFWVGSSDTQRLFVTLDAASGMSAPTESPTNVNPGQGVTVAGVIREVPADLAEWRERWKLDDAAAAALTEGQIYLAADRVAIAQPR